MKFLLQAQENRLQASGDQLDYLCVQCCRFVPVTESKCNYTGVFVFCEFRIRLWMHVNWSLDDGLVCANLVPMIRHMEHVWC